MGVPAEVAEYLLRPAERRFGIDNPVCPKQSTQESGEALRLGEMLKTSAEVQLVAAKGSSQTGDELAPEHTAENFYRQKERISRANPSRMIRRRAAGGNRKVHVGMMQQVLSPGVENTEESDIGSKMFGIGGHLQKRGRRRTEEQIVKDPRVLQRQHTQLARQREDDVEIAGIEKFPFTVGKPALARLRLAPRAVAIAA